MLYGLPVCPVLYQWQNIEEKSGGLYGIPDRKIIPGHAKI
jgi:hypothetical protein